MTQSYVPFLDSASATRKFHSNQRSNGSDTVEEYVQATAEPYLATYRIVTGALALSTANAHLLEIMAGASLRVGIRWIRVEQVANATAVASNLFSLYRLSDAGTTGTAITPAPTDPADAASGATAMTLPSSKGTETTLVDSRQAILHTTAATVGINPVALFTFEGERSKCLWIAAGAANGICIKNIPSDAAGTVRITASIVESAEGA